jgi:hypothetical protein
MKSKIVRIDIKLKHIDVAQCWFKKMIQSDHLHVEYLFTTKMMTDDLTKLLSSQKHKKFVRHLDLMNVQKLIE